MERNNWVFKNQIDKVPESNIKDTYNADVVVIGCGVSGLMTANSAIDEGLNVVIVTASSKPIARGGSNAASFSKAMKRAGYSKMDPWYLEKEIFANGNNVDQKKWYKWYNRSEEAFDYVIDYMESLGYETAFEQGNYIDPQSLYHAPIISHSWIKKDDPNSASVSQESLVKEFAKRFTDKGGTIVFNTAALYFEKEGTRVVSVIAKDLSSEKHIRYIGKKAVVIAAGDFSKDREMMSCYAPGYANCVKDSSYDSPVDYDIKGGNGLYKGDVIKAALWAGAAWQKNNPCCVMLSNFSGGPIQTRYQNFVGLLLDLDGERFMNEYCSRAFGPLSQQFAKKGISYAIWDNEWAEKFDWFNMLAPEQYKEATRKTPDDIRHSWDEKLKGDVAVVNKAGFVADNGQRLWYKADTLEDLIKIAGLPEKTLDTIQKYNKMCHDGHDDEYYKNPKYMIPIEKGPFYCQKSDFSRMNLFTVLGGPRTNINMQVCDENDDPIPGLYVVGCAVGDMFSGRYSFMIQGAVYGACCITFGYLTGKYIARYE